MRNDESHISDQEMLQIMDGEVHGRHAAALNSHLAVCWQCRTRRAQFESTIADFMELHNEQAESPTFDRSRNRLEMRLAELAATRWGFLDKWTIRRCAYAGLLLVTIVTVGTMIHFVVPGVHAASIPNARLTPGVARSVTREELCSLPNTDEPHPVPDRLAFRVFDKYGIHDPQPRTYEVDYLITPSLGGSDDIRNLWPEPYADGVWNAHVKDALEDRLHELVCSGKLDLTTAQHDISLNWIAAYKKYFHSDHPLEPHASFSIDPPWE